MMPGENLTMHAQWEWEWEWGVGVTPTPHSHSHGAELKRDQHVYR